jgi:hypothetical protein
MIELYSLVKPSRTNYNPAVGILLPHEILFIFYVFHLNIYDFASNMSFSVE